MGDSQELGYLYVLEDDHGTSDDPRTFLDTCVGFLRDHIGDEVFWFGWNNEAIFLPSRSTLSSLSDNENLDALSYLRVFSKGAEITWQFRGGTSIARLCFEMEEGMSPPTKQLGVWAQDSLRSPFHCRASRRILIGRVPMEDRTKSDTLFDLRYPRPFRYRGIECDRRERVQADVYEYLDRSTHRLVLVRYRSVGVARE